MQQHFDLVWFLSTSRILKENHHKLYNNADYRLNNLLNADKMIFEVQNIIKVNRYHDPPTALKKKKKKVCQF